ncbi:flagellar basal body-associated FliL family protein [Pleionea sp. CnH1-48]|uniref:flagellar basal body-associated FliL family protein n=1 Tax=Pleionea sp. CnH1-48 TaxID=2954494 RepID=UPI002096C6A8|nr:flagellar basal body-associated FliL family protein [Pleionea sp. CnH1-48]MCO7224534.1 flagellar basal body-associated protein FliL [Pleionea sp. CnH1-48]
MKTSIKTIFRGLMAALLLACSSFTYAEEAVAEVMYYDLDPNVITNYQKPPARRLGFITIDVQFQVTGVDNLDLLDYHKPLIEDTLIDVMNRQDEETIKSIDKRDAIREQIKEQLSALLKEETGKTVIDDVLFTKFIYQ